MKHLAAAGFFGKLPSHGDFVARRLPASFIEPWDAWLQAGMADSRARLGDDWLQVYLNSPIWRFALGSGVCGPQAWAGVMMPSVDRVGRYFHFTIAAGVDGVPAPAWYAALETLALSALGEAFSLPAFDAALLALSPTVEGDALPGDALFWLDGGSEPVQRDVLAASLFTEMLSAGPSP